MDFRARATETTTVLWYAGMKVSQVESAEEYVTAAFALSFVKSKLKDNAFEDNNGGPFSSTTSLLALNCVI
ncbi:hypothetical protein CJ030_MR6G000778 [Morella rubra]|uniref:Uncharacterized protein n=1 Tax=Morella rubra TaxID=262757 RepID=A0A6A1VAM9_9ROSI|nr:hypothetical protein CJ030_MR6G000778 [Morella rubra]